MSLPTTESTACVSLLAWLGCANQSTFMISDQIASTTFPQHLPDK